MKATSHLELEAQHCSRFQTDRRTYDQIPKPDLQAYALSCGVNPYQNKPELYAQLTKVKQMVVSVKGQNSLLEHALRKFRNACIAIQNSDPATSNPETPWKAMTAVELREIAKSVLLKDFSSDQIDRMLKHELVQLLYQRICGETLPKVTSVSQSTQTETAQGNGGGGQGGGMPPGPPPSGIPSSITVSPTFHCPPYPPCPPCPQPLQTSELANCNAQISAQSTRISDLERQLRECLEARTRAETQRDQLQLNLNSCDERTKSMQNELRQTYSTQDQKRTTRINDLETTIIQSEQKRREAELQKTNVEGKYNRTLSIIAQLEKRITDMERQRQQFAFAQSRLDDAEREVAILRNENENLKSQLFDERRRPKPMRTDDQSKRDFEDTIDQLRADVRDLEERNRRLRREQKSEALSGLEQTKRDLEDSQTEVRKLKADLNTQQSRADKLESKYKDSESEYKDKEHRAIEIMENRFKEVLKAKDIVIDGKQNELKSLQVRLDELEARFKVESQEKDQEYEDVIRETRRLEDIRSGTVQYQADLVDKLGIIQNELRPHLEGKSRETLNTLSRIVNRFTDLLGPTSANIRHLAEVSVPFATQQSSINEIKRQLDQKIDELEQAQLKIVNLTTQLSGFETDKTNEKRSDDVKYNDVKSRLDAKEAELQKTVSAANAFVEEIKRLQKQIADMKATSDAQILDHTRLQSEYTKLQDGHVRELEVSRQQLRTCNDRLLTQTTASSVPIPGLEDEKSRTLQTQLNDAKVQLANCQQLNGELQTSVSILQRQLGESQKLQTDLDNAQRFGRECQDAGKDLQNRFNVLQDQFNTGVAQFNESQARLSAANQEIAKLKNCCDDLQITLAKLNKCEEDSKELQRLRMVESNKLRETEADLASFESINRALQTQIQRLQTILEQQTTPQRQVLLEAVKRILAEIAIGNRRLTNVQQDIKEAKQVLVPPQPQSGITFSGATAYPLLPRISASTTPSIKVLPNACNPDNNYAILRRCANDLYQVYVPPRHRGTLIPIVMTRQDEIAEEKKINAVRYQYITYLEQCVNATKGSTQEPTIKSQHENFKSLLKKMRSKWNMARYKAGVINLLGTEEREVSASGNNVCTALARCVPGGVCGASLQTELSEPVGEQMQTRSETAQAQSAEALVAFQAAQAQAAAIQVAGEAIENARIAAENAAQAAAIAAQRVGQKRRTAPRGEEGEEQRVQETGLRRTE